ncbi:3-oxoacyl-ACP reductase family protein [Plasticicumulans acidivorans]|uniref:Acetoacetyl-CoA reductase/3-oxoacyl-[acyl-carrier protein] reductase n=1 Tax=Plasticicumulans acidivorans TaxID=886464 RepID=A0A317MXE2_9GAMM|nr:3-oxoacyl-ACP reductase family protein [Plasticicumulans acidivorans]PWV63297.1 acetoacetyl-CoA reductase/3-oxoacyl-[acyl-carrier protein] reductase [Plasticicumulans acidivorans]
MSERVALVTGASRGIGRAIALELAAAGHVLAVGYHERSGTAAEVVAEIEAAGGHALAVGMTVERRDSVCAALATVEAALGPVAVLVNNAAIAQEKPFATISDADWDQMLAVNLRGPFALSQEVLPGMVARGWGRIVNIVSIGGQWGGINQIHYASAKAGLIGLTRSLAKTYGGRGITVNAVSPGLVATEMTAAELASAAGQAKVAAIPAARLGTVQEVAAAVRYLASDAAAYVNGQTLNVNGGMYFG